LLTIEEAIEKHPTYSLRVRIGNIDVHVEKEHFLYEVNWNNAWDSITVEVDHDCNFLYLSTKART